MKKLDASDVTLYSSLFERETHSGKGYGIVYVVSNAHPTIKIIYLKPTKT